MKTLVLGDKRLEKRAKRIIAEMSQNPTGSIPQFCEDWYATKGTYNFVRNPTARAEQIIAAQSQASVVRGQGYEQVLILQDTTSLNFSHHEATTGLGPLENEHCQGFLAHSSLLSSPEGVPLGIVSQQVWARETDPEDKRPHKERPIQDKESNKWLQGLAESVSHLPAGQPAVVVSDRESDIYDYFVHPRPAQVELLVRAAQDRSVEDEAKRLWASLSTSPVRGKLQVEVSRRPGQAARVAECQVYYKRVKLKPPWRPAHLPKLAPITLWALLIREMHPPANAEPVEWLLLTTLPIPDFQQACQLLDFYAWRWLVERFHFVLKSGCALEQRQLRHKDRLVRFLALANVVACRLLYQTYLSRVDPDLPATTVFTEPEWKALYCFIHKTAIAPDQPPSLYQATRWLARLGGFLARNSDGQPGVKVLWRGWQRLFDISDTWLLFNSS